MEIKTLEQLINDTTEEFNELVDNIKDNTFANGELYIDEIEKQVNILGEQIMRLNLCKNEKCNSTIVYRL